MPIAKFNIAKVQKLVKTAKQHAEEAGLSITMEDLFNGVFYPGGKPLDEKGRTAAQAKAEGNHFWPCQDKMSPELITQNLTLRFQLVGDHGVYLITNAKHPENLSPSKAGTIVFAEGCDPSVDEDFYDNKVDIFGHDDGSVVFPIEWLETAIRQKKRAFRIKLTRSSVSLG